MNGHNIRSAIFNLSCNPTQDQALSHILIYKKRMQPFMKIASSPIYIYIHVKIRIAIYMQW